MARLEDSLKRLGDLGCLVHELTTDEIISGNQRCKALNLYGVTPIITERFDPPTPQGTVAVGYVIASGERFAYRAVKWTREQCQEANIVANAAGGSFDWQILAAEFPAELLVSTGLDSDALAAMQTDADALGKLLNPEQAPDFREYDESIADGIEVCRCSTCGHEHAKKN